MNRKILLIIFLFSVFSLFAFAQEQKTAILESGPKPVSGMPGIGINSIKGYKGIYKISNSGSASFRQEITIYFTQTEIPVFESWSIINAGNYIVYAEDEGNILIYKRNNDWTLFIEFPSSEDIILPFVSDLIKQMIYFVGDGTNFYNTSFPAIVNFQ